MSLIHINTSAALLPKATEEIARQTRMKKEGLVCSENLTRNPSIYGGKIYVPYSENEILPQHLSKRSEKGFNSCNMSRREGWDYKIWNFPRHDEPLAALHREEHWGSASFQEESFSNARRNVRTGLRLAGILGLLIPQAGEFQLSKHSIPELEQWHTTLRPFSCSKPAPTAFPSYSGCT